MEKGRKNESENDINFYYDKSDYGDFIIPNTLCYK